LQSSLSISCVTPAENNSCEGAREVEIGTTYTYDHVSAYPSQDTSCNVRGYLSETTNDTWYQFIGTGNLISFEDLDEFRSTPVSMLSGSCDNYECPTKISLGGKDAWQTEAGKRYFLRIMHNRHENLQFQLQEVTPPDNDDCINATSFALGDTVTVTLENSISSESTCNFGFGHDVWYEFTGNGKNVRFQFLPTQQYPFLFAMKGDCNELVCLPLTQETFNTYSMATEEGVSYYFSIYSNNSNIDFTNLRFTTSSFDPVVNDEYEDAIIVACGDSICATLENALADRVYNGRSGPSVWFKIIGTDEFYPIEPEYKNFSLNAQVKYFIERNNQLESYNYSFQTGPFFEKDSTYYINVYTTNVIDSFELKLDCLAAVPNDICADATLINFADTTAGTILYTFNDTNDGCSNSEFSTPADIWYVIEGDDNLYDFHFERDASTPTFSIFSGSCQALSCEEQVGRFNDDLAITRRLFLQQGEPYYIKIHGRANIGFKFYWEKVEIAENDMCNGAIPISCGMETSMSLDFATEDEFICGEQHYENKGIWFQLSGDNKYYEFNFPQVDHQNIRDQVNPSLYLGDCGNLTCANDLMIAYDRKFVLFAEAGKNYYFLFYDLNPVAFSVNCFEPESNDDYENAVELECDVEYSGYAFDISYTPIPDCIHENKDQDLWYSIVGRESFLYYENLGDSKISDVAVYTLANNELVCYDSFRDRTFLEEGQLYYIRVALADFHQVSLKYDYNIKFTCREKVGNGGCSSAITINCGDEIRYEESSTISIDEQSLPCEKENRPALWFAVEGDGTWKDFDVVHDNGIEYFHDIYAFEGDCETLTCLEVGRAFFAEVDQIYFVNIGVDPAGENGPFSIQMNCYTALDNELCGQAQTISCGETISSNMDFALLCDDSDNCTDNRFEKRLWYQIMGTGDVYHLRLSTEAWNEHLVEIEIFENGCCLDYVHNVYGEGRDRYFLAQAGKIYDVAVRQWLAVDNEGAFTLTVDCQSRTEVSLCESSITLEDGQKLNVDLTKEILFTPSWPGSSSEMSWISFIGSGGIDTLSLESENNYPFVYFFIDLEDNCEISEEVYPGRAIKWEEGHIIYAVSTLKDVKYRLGVAAPGFPATTTLDVTLNQSNESPPCEFIIPSKISGVQGEELAVPVSIIGGDEVFNISIVDGTISFSREVRSEETFNFVPTVPGYKFIYYQSETCWGNAILEVEITDWPYDPACEEENTFTPRFLNDKITEPDFLPVTKTADESFISSGELVMENIFDELKDGMVELKVSPNPFSSAAQIDYYLPVGSTVNFKLFSLEGKLLRTWDLGSSTSGYHQLNVARDNLPNGIYILRFEGNQKVLNKRLVIVNGN